MSRFGASHGLWAMKPWLAPKRLKALTHSLAKHYYFRQTKAGLELGNSLKRSQSMY